MATRLELKNVEILSSSSKAGRPIGSKFVLGKGIKIQLPPAEADKFLEIENQTKEFIVGEYDIPERKLTVKSATSYDTEKKIDYMFLNFTKVPQDKNKEYLKNDDDTWVENICNYVPDENNKFVPAMPVVNLNGQESDRLPYAGALVDLVLYVRPQYDEEKLTIYFNTSVESINIVKLAEGQTAQKARHIREIEIGGNTVATPKAEDKKATKTKAKKAEEVAVEPAVASEDDLDSIF